MGQSEEIEDAVEELKYGHPETRKNAAMKLGRIRELKVIPHLIRALKEDTYHLTRVNAIQSLTWIAHSSVIDPIIESALKDPHDFVRKTAIEALGNLKNTRAILALESIIKDNMVSKELIEAASKSIRIIREHQ